MPYMPPVYRPSGAGSRAEQKRQADRWRGSARERGYTSAWSKAAKAHLDRNPLCAFCAIGAWGDPPCDTAAELVDHLYPHRGDQAVFWDRRCWVASCRRCHAGPKQRVEHEGEAALVRLAARLGLPPEPLRGGGSKL